MRAGALEELRRLIARVGAETQAREVAAPAPSTHALVEAPRVARVRACSSLRAPARRPRWAPRAVTRGIERPGEGTTARLARLFAPAAPRRWVPPRTAGGRAAAVALRAASVSAPEPPRTRAAGRAPVALRGGAHGGRVAPLRTTRRRSPAIMPRPARASRAPWPALSRSRRARIPWSAIPPERLGLCWQRLLGEHRVAGTEVRLVGVFGPVRLGHVRGVALTRDAGYVVIQLGRGAQAGSVGDVVVARHADGRLLQTRVSRPGRLGSGGRRD